MAGNMERLKVLFVIDHLGGGGAEQQLRNLANGIDRERFEPHIFLTERSGARFDELDRSVEVHGLVAGGRRRTLAVFRLLRKKISEIEPHIIQSWLDYSTFLTGAVLKTLPLRHRFIASHRTSAEELYSHEVKFGRLKKALLIWAYKRGDMVTTNSKFLMAQLRGYGVERVQVIYNGVDLDTFRRLKPREELRKKLGLDQNLFYVCFAGSLVERKGVEYLMAAVRMIKGDNIRLLISGDGSLREKVERAAAADKRLIYLGYRENVVEYIKASNLLVLPSLYEGMPNVILEALAVGTPVLATGVYGIPELIEDRINGLLVRPRDAGEIAAGISAMIDDPSLAGRFAARSRGKIGCFGMGRMIHEYERLYASLHREGRYEGTSLHL
jgi:glycosyltransferase involved in cell wall biosynthesis